MKTALLIADLEGIAGVDHLEAIAFGSKQYPAACQRMTREVQSAIAGLREQGFTHVRVSDSHRSGSGAANVTVADAELRLEPTDSYGGPLLDGVSAICCVGMHAAGGTKGFAAHTVQAGVEWRLAGKRVSETELAVWLAAERGIPAIFASGDDVLGTAVSGLLPYVTMKRALSVDEARSVKDAGSAIHAAAARPPAPLASVPAGPLVLSFSGGVRKTFEGPTLAARYAVALEALPAADPPQVPGTRGFVKWAVEQILQTSRAFEGP